MKKIVSAFIILLFAASAAGYAQIYGNANSNSGALYSESSSSSTTRESDASSGGALYRIDSSNSPGDRPEIGEGIGQEAPLGEGLTVLLVCCLGYIIMKKKNVIAGLTRNPLIMNASFMRLRVKPTMT